MHMYLFSFKFRRPNFGSYYLYTSAYLSAWPHWLWRDHWAEQRHRAWTYPWGESPTHHQGLGPHWQHPQALGRDREREREGETITQHGWQLGHHTTITSKISSYVGAYLVDPSKLGTCIGISLTCTCILCTCTGSCQLRPTLQHITSYNANLSRADLCRPSWQWRWTMRRPCHEAAACASSSGTSWSTRTQ